MSFVQLVGENNSYSPHTLEASPYQRASHGRCRIASYPRGCTVLTEEACSEIPDPTGLSPDAISLKEAMFSKTMHDTTSRGLAPDLWNQKRRLCCMRMRY